MGKDLFWELTELFICLWPLVIPIVILRWGRNDRRPLYKSSLWDIWFVSWLVWLVFLTRYGFYLLWWGRFDWVYILLRLAKYFPFVLVFLRVKPRQKWLAFLVKFPWVIGWQLVHYWLIQLVADYALVVLLGFAFCC